MAAAHTLTSKSFLLFMLLLTFVSLYLPSEACNPVDQEALLEFKSQNQIAGSLPSSIGNLNILEIVNLDNMMLTGNLPDTIGNLQSLDELYLGNNNFTGQIPPQLASLQSLRTLDLHSNQLSGNIPENVLNMKTLQRLNVSSNSLIGSIPPHNANIPVSAFIGNPGLCGSPLPPC